MEDVIQGRIHTRPQGRLYGPWFSVVKLNDRLDLVLQSHSWSLFDMSFDWNFQIPKPTFFQKPKQVQQNEINQLPSNIRFRVKKRNTTEKSKGSDETKQNKKEVQ